MASTPPTAQFRIESFDAVDDSEQFERPDIPLVQAVLSGTPDREWQQHFLARARQLEQQHPGTKLEILANGLSFHTHATVVDATCALVDGVVQGANADYAAEKTAEAERIAARNEEAKLLVARIKEINESWPSEG
jgi:hypothetical protein